MCKGRGGRKFLHELGVQNVGKDILVSFATGNSKHSMKPKQPKAPTIYS